MEAAAELLNDHDVLREQLALLEEHLSSVRRSPAALSRLIDTLAKCLRRHTEREERLLRAFTRSGSASAETLEQVCDAHENHRMRLAVLHDLLANGGESAEQDVRAVGDYLIRELRELMTREELEWFPMLEQEQAVEDEAACGAAVDTRG